jgi:hypothetical protein
LPLGLVGAIEPRLIDGLLRTLRHHGHVMRSIPVSIGGVRYSSIKAAARALGVAPATVVARLKYTGKWRDKRRKPVTVEGATSPA